MKISTFKHLVIVVLWTGLLIPVSADDKAGGNPGDPKTIRKPVARDPIARIWWNQPEKVETLALAEGQRTKMDALARAYLEDVHASSAQCDAFDAFAESLKQGEWPTARERAQTMAEASGRPIQAQANLMIEVLSLLNATQRERIVAEYPALFRGPWLRTRGTAAQRQRVVPPRSPAP